MKPTDFEGSTCVFAEDQPDYLPLPAFKTPDIYGQVVTCWKLNLYERLKVLFTGKVWFSVLTFNMPLQPQLPSIDSPIVFEKKK